MARHNKGLWSSLDLWKSESNSSHPYYSLSIYANSPTWMLIKMHFFSLYCVVPSSFSSRHLPIAWLVWTSKQIIPHLFYKLACSLSELLVYVRCLVSKMFSVSVNITGLIARMFIDWACPRNIRVVKSLPKACIVWSLICPFAIRMRNNCWY